MEQNKQSQGSQKASPARSRLWLRALLVAATLLGLEPGRSSASFDDPYPMVEVRAFAAGKCTVHHDAGWYRLRLVSSLGTTPWRTFQIYSPIQSMPKVMVSPLR